MLQNRLWSVPPTPRSARPARPTDRSSPPSRPPRGALSGSVIHSCAPPQRNAVDGVYLARHGLYSRAMAARMAACTIGAPTAGVAVQQRSPHLLAVIGVRSRVTSSISADPGPPLRPG